MDIMGALLFELMIVYTLRRRCKNNSNAAGELHATEASIKQHQPNLLLFWLVWCMCGLLFDVLFVLWWCWELIVGDAFEALTNILISLLTMLNFFCAVIEFGFIYVIYHIYMNLLDVPHMPAFKLRFLKPLF
ncbi:CG43127 [Drosophila busckii]|uniref:CG43127 n=1 Tax=Drosophila busckii TaxID=30019 RepID=A0A0M4EYX3_DROBS|nr:CG43127 [Drosophila busckii]